MTLPLLSIKYAVANNDSSLGAHSYVLSPLPASLACRAMRYRMIKQIDDTCLEYELFLLTMTLNDEIGRDVKQRAGFGSRLLLQRTCCSGNDDNK